MELENPMTGLELTAVLPSLRTERGRRYHDLVLQWKSVFGQIDVPLSLVTEDVGGIQMQDPDTLYVEDSQIIDRLQARQEKAVFGHRTESVRASLFLVQNDAVAGRAARINSQSLQKLWKQAFLIQTKAVMEKMTGCLPEG